MKSAEALRWASVIDPQALVNVIDGSGPRTAPAAVPGSMETAAISPVRRYMMTMTAMAGIKEATPRSWGCSRLGTSGSSGASGTLGTLGTIEGTLRGCGRRREKKRRDYYDEKTRKKSRLKTEFKLHSRSAKEVNCLLG